MSGLEAVLAEVLFMIPMYIAVMLGDLACAIDRWWSS